MNPDEKNIVQTKKLFSLIFPHLRLNRSLRILVITNAVLAFIIGLFAPFYAVFIQHIGGNVAFAGLAWGLSSLVGGILIFLFSNWQLKIKEQELLIALGYVLRGVVFLSYAFMTNMTQLIATQILWGIATAIGTPAFDSVYTAHTSKENSILEWGQWEGVSAIVTGIAAFVGGLLIQGFGYEIIFMTMAVISFTLGGYIWRLPREVL